MSASPSEHCKAQERANAHHGGQRAPSRPVGEVALRVDEVAGDAGPAERATHHQERLGDPPTVELLLPTGTRAEVLGVQAVRVDFERGTDGGRGVSFG